MRSIWHAIRLAIRRVAAGLFGFCLVGRECNSSKLALVPILVLTVTFPLHPQAASKPTFTSSNTAAQAQFLPGLLATYSDGNHQVRLIVPDANFHLEPRESLHPSIHRQFHAEWVGFISVLQTGMYTFDTSSAAVSILGKSIGQQPIEISSGRHSIRIKYERRPGTSAVRLRWKGPGFQWEPIPSSRFSHSASQTLPPEEELSERGRELVESLGCVNCHAAASSQLKRRDGPDLTDIGSRVRAEWLSNWLKQPQAFRHDAVMPVMLTVEEQRHVTSYFVSLREFGGRESGQSPREQDAQRGRELYQALGCGACHNRRSVPLQGLGSKTTVSFLAEYLRNPLRFDPSGQMPSLLLTVEESVELASYLIQSRDPAFEVLFSPGDAEKGRSIVKAAGCLACHKLTDPEPLVNEHKAPKFRELSPSRGCLASNPKLVPRFNLTSEERQGLQAFLKSYRQYPDISPAPAYESRRDLERLRCVACHKVDFAGPLAALNEGTPPLTDIGAKLRSGWLEQVLMGVGRARTSLHIRMPRYDPVVVEPFVAGFAKEAGIEPEEDPEEPRITGVHRERGFAMLGVNAKRGGLGCIGCHDWGRFRSLGEEGPQLFKAAERLRYEWFYRWVLAPARIISGTSMPSYFTSMSLPDAAENITALWAALSRRQDVPSPEGLQVEEPPLGSEEKPLPEDEAIVVRWDMPEATPAAIAVGMPGGVSYCFDAGKSRLRYAWQGGFIDMTRTVVRKTMPGTRFTPTAEIIGEVFYRVDDFPFRVGDPGRLPQTRFRGYRMVEGYPEFRYEVDDIEVYERVIATEMKHGIIRQFIIPRVDQPLWFVVGHPVGVDVTSTLGTPTDGKLSIPAGERVRFDVIVTRARED